METIIKLSQQTIWQILGKATASFTTFFILALVTRQFGQAGTGVFTLSLTYLAFFYMASDLGLNAYLLPNLMSEKGETIWQKLLGLRILVALFLVISALFLVLLLPFDENNFKASVFFGLPAIVGFSIFTTSLALLQARAKYIYATISLLISSLINLLFVYLVIINSGGIAYLTGIHAVGWLVSAAVSVLAVKSLIKNIKPLIDFGFIKSTLQGAWPIALTLILNTVYFRIDSFLLTYLKTFSEVGVYNVAYQLFQLILVLPTFIMNGYYPMLLCLHSDNEVIFWRQLRLGFLIMIGMGLIGAVFTFLLSPIVLPFITGDGFSGSVNSLRILAVSLPAFFGSAVLMWALIVLKKYKTVLLIYLAGLILNFSLNYQLIPTYSYYAASWITGITEYLILLLQIIILIPIMQKR